MDEPPDAEENIEGNVICYENDTGRDGHGGVSRRHEMRLQQRRELFRLESEKWTEK